MALPLQASSIVADRSQQSTADKPLHRIGRQEHYPERLVGASDPYILLAHQGMVEEVLIDDMEARGVFVMRNSRFTSCSRVAGTGQLDIVYEDLASKTIKTIRAGYLVGCDGARSKVRECIPDAQLEGEVTNASWGVLDGELIRFFTYSTMLRNRCHRYRLSRPME